jgi:hypothetical protein
MNATLEGAMTSCNSSSRVIASFFVQLGADDWDKARRIGIERRDIDRALGIPELATHPEVCTDPEQTAANYGAEIAASMWLKVPFDENTDPAKALKYDLLFRGIKIDVKRPHERARALSIPSHSRDGWCDIYLVVECIGHRFKMRGWIPSKEARSEKYWTDKCDKPCWKIPFCDLRDPLDLLLLEGKRP